jgi:membrane-associated phospholipid phosphatase
MNYKQFFASFISSMTEPMAIFMLLALMGGWHVGLRNASYVWYVSYLLILSVAIWVARLRFMKTLHTNWDVSSRPKRVRLLLLLLGFSVLFFSSLWFFGSMALMKLSGTFFLWLLGFFLITLKVKISGHMAVLTLLLGYTTTWYGVMLLPSLLLLPIVGWSRVVLKRHTMGEVIGGFLYSVIFYEAWIRIFG